MKLRKILNEIKLVSMIPLEKGKMYDIKHWLSEDEWDVVEDFAGKDISGGYEPCEGTVDGEEGWYWMLGLKYKGIQDNKYIFYDTYIREDTGFDITNITKKDIRPGKKI
jgi:hypothetical protein